MNKYEHNKALKKWVGMNFKEWCDLDVNDDRKIIYTLKGFWNRQEQTAKFTSEQEVDYMMLFRVQQSIIKTIDLIANEWVVELPY